MRAYKIVRQFENKLASYTALSLLMVDNKICFEYFIDKWTVSENSPLFIFLNLEDAKTFLENEGYIGEDVLIFECEYTPYLGFISPRLASIASEISGTFFASRVKLTKKL